MGNPRRTELRGLLPAAVTKEQLADWKRNAVCALTGATDGVTLDHFIPLEWGHGGEYAGNLYFVAGALNASKSNWNPFRWYKKMSLTRRPIDPRRWEALVERLAKDSGLTPKEFRKFVHWCERNKRTPEQIRLDPRSSIELWKERI